MKRHDGFSYLEILLSVVLLVALLVPALQALQSGIAGSENPKLSPIAGDQNPSVAARQFYLRAKMEEVLAKPFSDLYSQTYQAGANTTSSLSSYSDATGADSRRNVVLYRYDPGTGALSANDTGLLFVSVFYEADGSANALSTLVGRWW